MPRYFIPTPKYPTACGGVTLLSEGRGKNPARAGGVLVWEFIKTYGISAGSALY
jgi:hypothetical protein